MRVLIIDDSRAMRSIISRIMRDCGFETADAADGQQALDVARTSHFDFAMVDWNMPVMNGLEFVRAARADASLADLRLIMCTTENEVNSMALALEAGANEYITKPFTKEVVLSKLELLGLVA